MFNSVFRVEHGSQILITQVVSIVQTGNKEMRREPHVKRSVNLAILFKGGPVVSRVLSIKYQIVKRIHAIRVH
jgi:hypothetical protein